MKPKLRYLSSFQRTGCDNSSSDILFSLNCRSFKNKALSVCNFWLFNKVDIFALKETWLGSSVDKSVISELKPDGYSIHNVSRQSQRGGGVAIVFNSDLKIELISNEIQFTHFEKLELWLAAKTRRFDYAWFTAHLHRGPTISETLVFFDEWSDFLDQVAVTPDELIITGDLFFYLDDTKNGDARKSCLDNLSHMIQIFSTKRGFQHVII